MNIERIGHWVAVIANIGVLGGFLVLAYQMKVQTEVIQTSSRYMSAELFTSSEVALMGDTAHSAYTKAVLTPKEIEPDELMQVWAYHSLAYHAAYQVFRDYENEIVSESDWLYAKGVFISYINHPIGLMWWETMMDPAIDAQSERFNEDVNAAISGLPKHQTRQQLLEMMSKIQDAE